MVWFMIEFKQMLYCPVQYYTVLHCAVQLYDKTVHNCIDWLNEVHVQSCSTSISKSPLADVGIDLL